MAKFVKPFGQNPTEQAFIDWLNSKNIDYRDVIEYDIRGRSASCPWPQLTITLYLRAEDPAAAEEGKASDG